MRSLFAVPTLLMLLALPAGAQVTVDLNALDPLKKTVPAPNRAKPKAAKPAAKPVPPPAPKPLPAPVIHVQPPGFHAPLPALPGAPPPDVALAPVPPPVAPANKRSTPTPPVLATGAGAGAGAGFPGGLRITFGSGQGELSPASERSIQTLVGQAPNSETVSYNVLAYAPGTAGDPSTARRLSLARALAVRSVLMGAGVPSTRIYVRALGTPTGGTLPDRVDISVLGANAPPPDLALPPPAQTPPENSMPQPGAAKTP